MKKTAVVATIALAVLLGTVLPGQARPWHHGPRVGVGVYVGPYWGPGWWDPWYPYPYYPPPPAYYSPPVVIQQEPQTFIEREPSQQPSYWYYCESAKAYYPYVKECPSGWLKVAPSPGPGQ